MGSVLIHLSRGQEDVERATLAFVVANAGLTAGQEFDGAADSRRRLAGHTRLYGRHAGQRLCAAWRCDEGLCRKRRQALGLRRLRQAARDHCGSTRGWRHGRRRGCGSRGPGRRGAEPEFLVPPTPWKTLSTREVYRNRWTRSARTSPRCPTARRRSTASSSAGNASECCRSSTTSTSCWCANTATSLMRTSAGRCQRAASSRAKARMDAARARMSRGGGL